MGIDFALTRFFDAVAREASLDGPALALGSLAIHETDEEIKRYARENGYARLSREHTVAALLSERYGIKEYLSCDINGRADIELDLSKPLPVRHRNAYRLVLNAGTLEHIFDIRQAMENIHDATTVGGVMLHTTPVSWYDHGFFNFNPVLFHLLAAANNYEISCEGFYYSPPTLDGQTRPVVSILEKDARIPGSTITNASIWARPNLPANAMHLIALRKNDPPGFRSPTQVST